jgi:hypothetical protein
MRIKVVRKTTTDLRMFLANRTALVCGVTAGLYTVLGLDPHPFVNTMLSFGPALTVVLWLERDVQRTGVGAVHDIGMFLMMGWWIAIPWYTIKTRGRDGWRLMARLFGLIFASYVGALAAFLLFAVFRFLVGR